MAVVRLRNINPLGQVDLPLIHRQEDPDGSTLGQNGVGCLEPGEVFEIDADLAGYGPRGSVEDGTYDPGVGLLAQVGNYELVDGDPVTPPALPDPTPEPVDAASADATVTDPAQQEG